MYRLPLHGRTRTYLISVLLPRCLTLLGLAIGPVVVICRRCYRFILDIHGTPFVLYSAR